MVVSVVEYNPILDKSRSPSFAEINSYMYESGRALWVEMNEFIQQRYKCTPKVSYSVCSGKPGWNVKYHKSGKSLCTLYPEKDSFVALIVVKLDLVPVIEGMQSELDAELITIVRNAVPFNGTKWLMIPVCREGMLAGVKELLLLKASGVRS